MVAGDSHPGIGDYSQDGQIALVCPNQLQTTTVNEKFHSGSFGNIHNTQ